MSITVFSAVLSLVGSIASAAGTPVPVEYALSERDAPLAAIVRPARLISFGLGFQHYDYAEELLLPMKSKEKGLLPVLRVDAREPGSGWGVGMSLGFGSLAYDGALQDRSGNYQGDHQDSSGALLLDLKTSWGWRLVDNRALVLTPYTGLGFHYWSRKVAQSSDAGLREDYQWIYLPIGVRSEHSIGKDWKIETDLSLLIPFWGTMRIERVEDAKVDLGTELGFRAELPVSMPLSEAMRGIVMPWYQYSAIGQSNVHERYKFYEPASKTYEYGLHLGVSGQFF
jgi:hypothetical protein